MFRKLAWSIIAITLAVSTPAHAIEAPAILSGPTKVKDIISHFRSEMSAIVAQAGDESRLTLTRAYELMDDLLKSLEVAYANALDKTFADLDAQQQKAFQDAAATLEKFDASVKSGTDAALQISTDVNTTVYEIAAWADTPLVTKRGPIYVEPRSFGDPITFTVSGFKLGRGHPRLLVNGQAAQPGNLENNELSFVLPRAAYPSDPTKVIQVQARLTVFKSPGWWCIVCRDDAIEYAFTQYVLPEDLGTYQHVQQIHEKKTAKQPYISDWVDTGETQTSNLPKTQCFEPTKGWSFIWNTAYIGPQDKDLKGWWVNHSPDHNYNGGEAKLTKAQPDQICIYVLARPTTTNSYAQTIARFRVVEMQEQERTDEIEGPVHKLDWGKETVDRYDPNRTSSYLRVTLFDGFQRIAKTDLPSDFVFLKVIPDERDRSVLLRPQRAWVFNPR